MYENYYNKVKHCKERKRKRKWRGKVGEGKGGTAAKNLKKNEKGRFTLDGIFLTISACMRHNVICLLFTI